MNSGIFLLLGTNLGDKLKNLSAARSHLEHSVGKIATASSVYKTGAWGKTDQPEFYNQVIAVQTILEPHQLLETILAIEQHMGRIREEKWGPRIIDIDILLYHELVLHDPVLTIPHVGIPGRRFVLEPLHEIAPALVHPLLNKTIIELLKACEDHALVEKIL